eukprot:89638_1
MASGSSEGAVLFERLKCLDADVSRADYFMDDKWDMAALTEDIELSEKNDADDMENDIVMGGEKQDADMEDEKQDGPKPSEIHGGLDFSEMGSSPDEYFNTTPDEMVQFISNDFRLKFMSKLLWIASNRVSQMIDSDRYYRRDNLPKDKSKALQREEKMRISHGEFPCKLCSGTFHKVCKLNRHMKIVHKQNVVYLNQYQK